ncbi:LytTR family transcriptional regulator DNA-binding domain-containing protein [Algoriphagus halophilus]|uniref:LytTR family transcriptional regulator DNA-binding domain-containing protein n=1 Tax=Algoriphagus halophilus TaxID=226505 RepID=UPI00358FE034
MVRCHRSYTINLFHLANYEGNNQQGMIKLDHVAKSIPVSRSYASNLLLQLK